MNALELGGVLSLFGQELAPFQYFKDKYALCLAAWAAGDGMKVADMKRSRLAGLLQKDVLKQYCAQHGLLRAADLAAVTSTAPMTFYRSLDQWGQEGEWHWTQVSRPGMSLVLRLDFGPAHTQQASRLRINPTLEQLHWRNHMQAGDHFNLAWCRMDLDWETGEVLIEEIQNDWLRSANQLVIDEPGQSPSSHWYQRPRKADRGNDLRFLRYHREVLGPLEKIWSEAMLCATLEFVRDTLGLQTVYMHTHECGARLKGMYAYNMPPRSIYQDLPRKFCFGQTDKAPVFLSRSWGQMLGAKQAGIRSRVARPFQFWKMEL